MSATAAITQDLFPGTFGSGRGLMEPRNSPFGPGSTPDVVARLIAEPHRDEALRPLAAEEVHRPRGVGGIGRAEVLDHRLDLLSRAHRLVEPRVQAGELLHAEAPSSAASTASASSSPFHWLAIARASPPPIGIT